MAEYDWCPWTMDHEAIEDTALPDYRTYTSMSMEGEAAAGRIAIWAAWLEQTLAYFCSALINGSTGVGGDDDGGNDDIAAYPDVEKTCILGLFTAVAGIEGADS